MVPEQRPPKFECPPPAMDFPLPVTPPERLEMSPEKQGKDNTSAT